MFRLLTYVLGSLPDEYLWSQLEPAGAVLCACLVTYRPLFTNVNLFIPTRLSSLFSLSTHGSSSQSNHRADGDHERRLQYKRPATPEFSSSMTDPDMYAKVSKHGVHVIETRQALFGNETTCEAGIGGHVWGFRTE